MLRGGLAADAGARALQTCMEMTLPKEAEVELNQVMKSLGSGGKEEINNQSDTTGMLIDDHGRMVIRIPAHLQHVLLGPRAKAYMARPAARPAVDRTSVEDDKSNICTDCCASMTITGSLANTTDVQAKSVIVDMAESGTSMNATHTCMKTYFVKNRTGEVVTITTPALYVKSVHQDLLSGKACNRANIRIILDEDPDISGLYPLDEKKQQHIEESIPFISEPTDLYLLKIEEMDWRKFHATNGYDLWHRRLMHCPNRNIRESIQHTKGMEKLLKYRFNDHDKCPSCMIGKSTKQDTPGPIKRATKPFEKVTFDLIISSVTSIEGFNAAALYVDDASAFKWLYGLKSKDEALNAAQRWMAETSQLREKYPLYVVMRDNAGENKSKEISEYFTSKGVTNRYATAYEQHQDCLSERVGSRNQVGNVARQIGDG